MLSLIICSVNSTQLKDIRQNIDATIGVEYELLVWDNRNRNIGLCSVYNRMAVKAKFPFLCFLHEDLVFQTGNWGQILLNIFQSPQQPALIGLAGGRYKAKSYSGWFSGLKGSDFYHIYHEDGGIRNPNSNMSEWPSPEVQVACIDGVLMAVKKDIWEQFSFNDDLLTGFHFYDLDFSLRIAQSFPVVITNRIDVVHLTKGGDFGDRWVKQAFMFHEAWKEQLPFSVNEHPNSKAEEIVAKTWLNRLKDEPISFANRKEWVQTQGLHKRKKLWMAVSLFLMYRPSGIGSAIRKMKRIKNNLVK